MNYNIVTYLGIFIKPKSIVLSSYMFSKEVLGYINISKLSRRYTYHYCKNEYVITNTIWRRGFGAHIILPENEK